MTVSTWHPRNDVYFRDPLFSAFDVMLELEELEELEALEEELELELELELDELELDELDVCRRDGIFSELE